MFYELKLTTPTQYGTYPNQFTVNDLALSEIALSFPPNLASLTQTALTLNVYDPATGNPVATLPLTGNGQGAFSIGANGILFGVLQALLNSTLTPVPAPGAAGAIAQPTLGEVAGGSLAATTYYVKVTAQTYLGETIPGAEQSFAVGSGNLLQLTWTPVLPSIVTALGIYVSTTSGGELNQGPMPYSAGSWTMPSTGILTGGGSPPTLNTSVALPPVLDPVALTLGETPGGSLAATTYYVKVTAVNALGETLPSSETSYAVGANNLLTVQYVGAPLTTFNPLPTGWNIYASTTSGAETLQNSAPLLLQESFGLGNTLWTMPSSGLITGGASPPTVNTTAGVNPTIERILLDIASTAGQVLFSGGTQTLLPPGTIVQV